MKRTGVFANGLIWFGAAVSIAEIEAGCSIGGNLLALVAGHLLGGVMLFAAGLIGATTGRNAMETTAATFGKGGMRFFAALNILQLVGWTAVMIAQGAAAVSELTGISSVLPSVALAALIAGWIFIAFNDRFRLAVAAMGTLAVMCVVLTWKLAGGFAASAAGEAVPFWSAFEISVAMPLSWLPLISDYTSSAERPRTATAVSAAVYTLVSIWMYVIGMMLSAIGANSVADGIVKCGIGGIGLVVVVFSTVTTTFMDAYSSGESAKSVFARVSPRPIGVAVCIIGGALAVGGVMDHYLDFLYFISSVFAPMAAVLLIDRYLTKKGAIWWNLFAWLAGFVVYQFAGSSPIGPTLTAIAISSLVASAQFPFSTPTPH